MKHWDNLNLATRNKIYNLWEHSLGKHTDREVFTDELIDILVGGKEMKDGFIGAAAERQERLDKGLKGIHAELIDLSDAIEDGRVKDLEVITQELDDITIKVQDLEEGKWL